MISIYLYTGQFISAASALVGSPAANGRRSGPRWRGLDELQIADRLDAPSLAIEAADRQHLDVSGDTDLSRDLFGADAVDVNELAHNLRHADPQHACPWPGSCGS